MIVAFTSPPSSPYVLVQTLTKLWLNLSIAILLFLYLLLGNLFWCSPPTEALYIFLYVSLNFRTLWLTLCRATLLSERSSLHLESTYKESRQKQTDYRIGALNIQLFTTLFIYFLCIAPEWSLEPLFLRYAEVWKWSWNFFNSSHNYFCHFLHVQLSPTLWMPSKRDCPKVYAVIPICTIHCIKTSKTHKRHRVLFSWYCNNQRKQCSDSLVFSWPWHLLCPSVAVQSEWCYIFWYDVTIYDMRYSWIMTYVITVQTIFFYYLCLSSSYDNHCRQIWGVMSASCVALHLPDNNMRNIFPFVKLLLSCITVNSSAVSKQWNQSCKFINHSILRSIFIFTQLFRTLCCCTYGTWVKIASVWWHCLIFISLNLCVLWRTQF